MNNFFRLIPCFFRFHSWQKEGYEWDTPLRTYQAWSCLKCPRTKFKAADEGVYVHFIAQEKEREKERENYQMRIV